jgi:hypothetical protein
LGAVIFATELPKYRAARELACKEAELKGLTVNGALVMPTATLNLSIIARRMLSKADAAHYCGLAVRRFEVECPVRPVRVGEKTLWDIRDLDEWLNTLKESKDDTADKIIARLS